MNASHTSVVGLSSVIPSTQTTTTKNISIWSFYKATKAGHIVSLLSNPCSLKASQHSHKLSNSLIDKVSTFQISAANIYHREFVLTHFTLFARMLNCGQLHLLIKIGLLIHEPNTWKFPIRCFYFSTEVRRICRVFR